jgi:hypothetical protein
MNMTPEEAIGFYSRHLRQEYVSIKDWAEASIVVGHLAREALEWRKKGSGCDACPASEEESDKKAYCNLCRCMTCKYRKEPSIAEVLDEIEGDLHRLRGITEREAENICAFLRAKYCPPPEKEKPTLNDLLVLIIRALPLPTSEVTTLLARLRLLDQLKEVEK